MFRIFAFSFTRLNLPQLCTDKVTSISYFEADQELKKKQKKNVVKHNIYTFLYSSLNFHLCNIPVTGTQVKKEITPSTRSRLPL